MLFVTVILLLATCLPYSYQGNTNQYCKISKSHTMCKYKGLGKSCGDPGGYGVNETEKALIVDLHNCYRSRVARGMEKRGSKGAQPNGANILQLSWDDELAKIAQRWADQCTFKHDERNVPRFKVGQNLYWKSKYPVHHVNWTEAIQAWFDEVKLFNPKGVPRYRFSRETGHYTQIMWHSTYKIGCGRRDYGPNKIYVCNYGPSGNYNDQPMYYIGPPCSKCPAGTSCVKYLCAREKKRSEDEDEFDEDMELSFKSDEKVENEVQPQNNSTNRLKLYLIVQFNNKSYVKPISFLDELLNANTTETFTENIIDEETLYLNEEERETIFNVKTKIEQLDLE